MILPICETGEPVLRGRARELTAEEILSAPVQDLIAHMFETMYHAPGVGLAAPQIGVPLQLVVIEDKQDYINRMTPAQVEERLRTAVAPHVIVNPRIVLEPGTPVEFFEGCLSLPGFTAMVPRALAVRVDCLNERAEPVTLRARGWYARILQHEIDHLHGTLYIDRMVSRSFANRVNFESRWKDVSADEFWRAMGREPSRD